MPTAPPRTRLIQGGAWLGDSSPTVPLRLPSGPSPLQTFAGPPAHSVHLFLQGQRAGMACRALHTLPRRNSAAVPVPAPGSTPCFFLLVSS